MKYRLELDLAIPRDKAIDLFDSTENAYKWQPTLISFEHLSGTPGQDGAKSKLFHKMGRREVEMSETIEKRNFPDEFIAIYEAKGVWNRIENHFVEVGPEQTQWIFDCEFRCSGFVRLMTLFAPWVFKKQSRKTMQDFKSFAEAECRNHDLT